MSTDDTQPNETNENDKSKLPTHVAKVRHGYGKNVSYEQVGVAWKNEKGSLYVKLHGTQIVEALTLYELKPKETAEE